MNEFDIAGYFLAQLWCKLFHFRSWRSTGKYQLDDESKTRHVKYDCPKCGVVIKRVKLTDEEYETFKSWEIVFREMDKVESTAKSARFRYDIFESDGPEFPEFIDESQDWGA